MASIQKRGEHQYQVEIRRKGYPYQTRTFETRAQAETWARAEESKIDKGEFKDLRPLAKVTLGDALDKYAAEVVPKKALGGQRNERNRIRLLKKHPLAMRTMVSLQSADFAKYRNQRLDEVGSANTVRLEIALLSHLYTVAIKEWSWPVQHLLQLIKKPSAPEGRDRRLLPGEEGRLLAGAQEDAVRKPLWLTACIRLALVTGMRACELLSVEWTQVNLSQGLITLTKALNGSARSIGLTHEAVNILKGLPREHRRVIPGYAETGKLDADFKAACIAKGLMDLHFHDLRHEAASRLAPHMLPLDLAKIMGWKTLQMAMRYYNPTGSEMVNKLRQIEAMREAQHTSSESPCEHKHVTPPPVLAEGESIAFKEPILIGGNVVRIEFGRQKRQPHAAA